MNIKILVIFCSKYPNLKSVQQQNYPKHMGFLGPDNQGRHITWQWAPHLSTNYYFTLKKRKNNPTETIQAPLYAKKTQAHAHLLLQPKPITQLNKLHDGKIHTDAPKTTLFFLSVAILPPPLPTSSHQLPEVAVTLKQSILHSLTDFIMPPNLLYTHKHQLITTVKKQRKCISCDIGLYSMLCKGYFGMLAR